VASARPGSRRRLTASIDTPLALLGAAEFLSAAALGALFPLLAKIQAAHHLPTYALGIMSGASFFAALVAQLSVAPLLDGKRARWVLLLGLLVGAVALLWFARASDLWQLVAARALGGVSYGIIGPAALRQAAVGFEGEVRGQRLGILSSLMMAGIVMGPLFGSLLYIVGGLALPFQTLGVMFAVLLAVSIGFLPHPHVDEVESPAPPRPHVHVGDRAVIAVLVFAVASQLPNGLYDALWSRLLTDRGADQLLIGLSLSLFGLPFIVLAPFGGRLAERKGPLLAAAVALVVSDVFMFSYGLVPSPVAIVILGVAEACAQCVAVPGGYAAVARVFPDTQAATGQAWFSASGTAAGGVAATAGAPVYAAFGPGAAFGAGAVASALAGVLSVLIARGHPELGPAAPIPAEAPVARAAGLAAPPDATLSATSTPPTLTTSLASRSASLTPAPARRPGPSGSDGRTAR
jgi:MFS family permease